MYAILTRKHARKEMSAVVDQLDDAGFEVYRGRNHYSILPYGRNSTIGCIFSKAEMDSGAYTSASRQGLDSGVRANDRAIIQTYAEGDPYTSLAIAAGLMPFEASKHTHPWNDRSLKRVRWRFNTAPVLALCSKSPAAKVRHFFQPGVDLWRTHRQLYPNLWKWTRLQMQRARWEHHLDSEFGWRLHVAPNTRTEF